jgi:uncharacterized protein (DUF302 family)
MKHLKILVALLFMGSTMAVTAQNAHELTIEKKSKYQLEQTVEEIKESAKDHGWSIPTEHDMQASLKKAGKTIDAAQIIVLCNANHAFKILNHDAMKHYSSMLPCRVSVYEKDDGNTYVAMMNMKELTSGAEKETRELMATVQKDIHQIIKRVLED